MLVQLKEFDPRLKKALFADSTAIVAGAALGTSSTTPYIESASALDHQHTNKQ
jgi:xanthine/uracil/vitamin C permease (AzgA family)